ncbi:GAF domain-containing protein, partial [Sedimenticola sp.]|uniref:GAF domain-containing protein n=1 Tax=Sedimenticola sp. TaxID=1940285 RepID=UPI003D145924
RIETAVLPSDATAYRICREVEPVIWYRDDADQSALPIGVEVIDKFDSYLALPLKGADHVVGVIEAFNLLEPQNAAQQIDLLAEIAGSAGLALYNGMLYQEAQQSRQSAQEYLDMQNVLHEINIELFRIDDLDELYRSAVELAHTRLGFDRVGMFLLNETKDLLLGTYGVDVEGNICDEKGPEYIIDQKETIDAFVLNRTRLMVTEDIDLWYSGEVVGRGWHIGAAMWIEESPIGVIFADNLLTGRPLKPYQSELLFAYAGVVSNLIQRNRFETIITNRAIEMQAVAEVGTAAATILDTDKLLQEVVDLTKNRFDLYHAHIYLLDKTTETLVLTSGAGKIGQQMVAEGRQIPLNQEQSLVARAARSRQGVVINDVKSEPGFLPHPLLPDTRSEMAVPLITGDQVLGVLDVQSDRLNYFSKEDISTFTTLAAQMAVALQNARLFTESEKRASELAFISRIVTEINVSDIETGLQFMAEELGEILQVPLVNVRLIDETGNMLKIAAARHPAEVPSPVGTVFPITKDPVNDALQARQTVIIEDVANAKMPPHTQKRLLEAGIQSVYMIPMAAGRDLIGSIAMSI